MDVLNEIIVISGGKNRGKKLNLTSLEEWMSQAKAPALEHSVKLFNSLKALGVQIILVSSRRETLRAATVNNLVDQGIFGWKSLILRFENVSNLSSKFLIKFFWETWVMTFVVFLLLYRGVDNEWQSIQNFKSDVRKQLINKGYSIWGILGDQWSSIEGLPSAKRAFKLPNPLYYTA